MEKKPKNGKFFTISELKENGIEYINPLQNSKIENISNAENVNNIVITKKKEKEIKKIKKPSKEKTEKKSFWITRNKRPVLSNFIN
jgi:hypothetical protein